MSKTRSTTIILLALLLLAFTTAALATSSANYAIHWQVMSAGGAPATSNSGHISMNGTLGQTAIGPSSVGQTSIFAGFWHSLKQALLDFFLPLVMRSS